MALGIVSLHCDMRDLWLWHLNSVVACGIEFPDQGLNLGPLHGEHGVLATGPPEKLLMWSFLNNLFEIASTAPCPVPAVWGSLPPLLYFIP